MNIFNNDIDHLSIKEIRAYLDNQMSNREMHDFERHLLSCELCNDAFEGYQSSGLSFEKEIKQHLESSLANLTKSKRFPKMAIAASIVILLCASIVFVFTYFENDSTEVSMVEKEKEKPAIAPLELEDSVESIQNEIEKEPAKTERAAKTRSNPEQIRVEPKKIKKEELVIEDESSVLEDFNQDDSILEEIVSEDIVLADDQKESAFGGEGLGVNSAKSRMKKEAFSQRSLAAPLSTEKNDNTLSLQNAMPAVGIDSYKLYLKDSLRYPASAKQNQLQGLVLLRFEVNKKGEVYNLTVKKGLSTDCDLEAKRLVLEGSKWVLIDKNLPIDENVVNLTIEFTLE